MLTTLYSEASIAERKVRANLMLGNPISPADGSSGSGKSDLTNSGKPYSYVRELLQEKLLSLKQQIESIRENKSKDNFSQETYISMKKDQIAQIEKLLLYMDVKINSMRKT